MGPWDDCSWRLLTNVVPVEKKTLLLVDDTTLGRFYCELLVKCSTDVIATFKSALEKGHVLSFYYKATPQIATITFVDESIIILSKPIPVQSLYEIWMAWHGEQPEESTINMNQDFKKERNESMNINCMCTTALDRTARAIPEVKLIQRRGRCTIVKWQDGTETKVVLEEGKPDTGIFGAYCIALAKKCAGSTEKLLRTIDDHDERVIKCRYMASAQKLREKRLKKAAENRKRKWEEDVAAAMYDSRVRDEAIKRLWAKEEKEDI